MFLKSFQCVHVCFNFGVSYPMTWIDMIQEISNEAVVFGKFEAYRANRSVLSTTQLVTKTGKPTFGHQKSQ